MQTNADGTPFITWDACKKKCSDDNGQNPARVHSTDRTCLFALYDAEVPVMYLNNTGQDTNRKSQHCWLYNKPVTASATTNSAHSQYKW